VFLKNEVLDVFLEKTDKLTVGFDILAFVPQLSVDPCQEKILGDLVFRCFLEVFYPGLLLVFCLVDEIEIGDCVVVVERTDFEGVFQSVEELGVEVAELPQKGSCEIQGVDLHHKVGKTVFGCKVLRKDSIDGFDSFANLMILIDIEYFPQDYRIFDNIFQFFPRYVIRVGI